MNALRPRTALLALAVLLASCSGKGDAPPPEKPKEGRAETQAIRNTEAIGYSGKAIANQVDAALKQNDQQVKKAEAQSTEEAPPH